MQELQRAQAAQRRMRGRVRRHQRAVEELQLDVHHLNNMVNPILPLAPTVEEDPNVLIAEDYGMEVDAEDEPKDEEIEPFKDDHGDGVFDIDNDHPEEYLSYSI